MARFDIEDGQNGHGANALTGHGARGTSMRPEKGLSADMRALDPAQGPPKVPKAPEARRIDVFGFKLNPMLREEFLEFVAWHIANRKRALVTHLNLHGMAMVHESEAMAALMKRPETVVTVDGMSIIVISRLAGHKLSARHRVTSLDYFDAMLRRSIECGWNLYYVGAKNDVLVKGLDYFQSKYPDLKIAGHDGYFDVGDTSEDAAQHSVLDDIAARKTDLLIVGMGMPRQEEWVESICDRTDVPVIITIGAMLEYYAGSLPMPPRWLGPLGLEWLFRLATAPRRLAFRYLIEPFIVLRRLVKYAQSTGKVTPNIPE